MFILQKNNIKIYEIEPINAYAFLCNFKKIGILCGLVFCFFMFVFSQFFVFNVTIIGDVSFVKDGVENVLKTNNLDGLKFKANVNAKQLENQLLQVDYVSFASVAIRGNSIIISIKQQLVNKDFVAVDKHNALVSCYDGIVTDIKVISGTKRVEVGSYVCKGDVLIEPYFYSNNKKISVQAVGNIVMDTYVTESKKVLKNTLHFVESKEKKQFYCLSFLKFDVFNNKPKVCPFEFFEESIKSVYVTKYLLPIKKTTTTYTKLEYVQNVDYDLQLKKYIKNVCATNLLKVSKYDIIKGESVDIDEQEDCFYITHNLIVGRKIV